MGFRCDFGSLLCAAAALAGLSAPVVASEKRGCLTLATLTAYTENPNISLIGEAVFSDIGQCVTIVPMPTRRAEQLSKAGSLDGQLMRTAVWAKLHDKIVTSVPTPIHAVSIEAVALRSRGDISIAGFEDLRPYRVLIGQGHRWMETQMKANEISYEAVGTHARFTEVLLSGKADVGVTDSIVVQALPKQEILKIMPVTRMEYHIVLRHRHSHLVVPLDQALQRYFAR